VLLAAALIAAAAMAAMHAAPSQVLGHSVRGRAIRVSTLGNPSARKRVLVVGCIHGTECAGTDVVRRLIHGPSPAGARVWAVPDLNPDGHARDTRVNGRGVNLNRNFPFAWSRHGRPWDLEYSGPRPFSEPEPRIARDLVRRVRPAISIWFHQQGDPLVRAWGRSIPAARRYARLAHLRFVAMPWVTGSASNWQNHLRGGGSSFVVEIRSGALPAKRARQLAEAVRRL
jgi:predicted deacylase